MKKIVVYFHGYGSSPVSSKTQRLTQESDFDVWAYHIDVDPSVSLKFLEEKIDSLLLEYPHTMQAKLVFVGTSLGAWYACKMAKMYRCHAVLINPSVNPQETLQRYGVSADIRDRYHVLAPYEGHKYFFAEEDTILPDNVKFRENLMNAGYDVEVVAGADHRFGGEPFERVINYLKELK